MRTPVVRSFLAAMALLTLLGACGSTQATKKLTLAADTTTTETQTVTEPAKTVTTPARTETVTKTKTTTTPGKTTTIHSATTVAVKPTSGGESSGGIPSWAWVLIGAGAVLLAVAIFMLGHTRGQRRRDEGPPPRSGSNQPPAPPRGPPEDPI
jgi:hypothetical protein